jgi:hypothetical protein
MCLPGMHTCTKHPYDHNQVLGPSSKQDGDSTYYLLSGSPSIEGVLNVLPTQRPIITYPSAANCPGADPRKACPWPTGYGRSCGRNGDIPSCKTENHRGTRLWADETRTQVSLFPLRGLQKVRGEWTLTCTTHNVRKLWPPDKNGLQCGRLLAGLGY